MYIKFDEEQTIMTILKTKVSEKKKKNENKYVQYMYICYVFII